ncbi:MAG: hypothetical protein LBK43_01840 [Treponema sp.]|nr:hypothetical protein [Treponema sp.]
MLIGYGMVGVRRIRALVGLIFSFWISEGTIEESGKRVMGPVGGIRTAVLRGEVVHFDETGMRNRGYGGGCIRRPRRCSRI